jgi:hypothetical protein
MTKAQFFYTAKQINNLRVEAQFYKLDAPREFWSKTANELRKVCNGAGAESWSENKRKALTAAIKPYESCIAVHDVDYYYQIGSRDYADKRLKKNMLRVWRKKYGVWRWFNRGARIERLIVIPGVYAAVALGGQDAWEACQK